MSDDKVTKVEKKHGFIRVIIMIFLVLLIIAGTVYFYLPKIVSSALSGGAVSTFMPKEIRENTKEIRTMIKMNLGILAEMGISNEQARDIVSNIEFKAFDNVIQQMDSNPVKNTNELIDLLSTSIDLSTIDINRIKKEYYSELSPDVVEEIVNQYQSKPGFKKIGFNVVKNTVLVILKDQDKRVK